ncbi:hypothetical protein BZL30_7667 [Mycobacterium kansasii]|uniref:Uncharacterized protein n=1 Tax=Mycobacterium kansasii TaxID=1768 RepID=A0A1V3WKP2_MYCKA|nr:hypothetical protein BZL30_7667 [Mycobacterium kansasii]
MCGYGFQSVSRVGDRPRTPPRVHCRGRSRTLGGDPLVS